MEGSTADSRTRHRPPAVPAGSAYRSWLRVGPPSEDGFGERASPDREAVTAVQNRRMDGCMMWMAPPKEGER